MPSAAFLLGQRHAAIILDAVRVGVGLALLALLILGVTWLCTRFSETLGGIAYIVGGLGWILMATGAALRWYMRNFPNRAWRKMRGIK